jgi:hypothetical protein
MITKWISRGQWHWERTIHVAPIVSWLMDKWKGSIYFLYSFKTVWPWITLLQTCVMTTKRISTPKQWHCSHISCSFCCIMAHGQMEGIHLFFVLFQDSLTINYTTSNLATYKEEVLGWTKYHQQDSDIQNTGIRLVLLDHGSWTNGRDPSIFYTLSRQFDHELHYFKVGITHKRH